MFAPGMQNIIILISVSNSRLKYMNKIKGPFQLYLTTEKGWNLYNVCNSSNGFTLV
jgi:hypothetical protein